MAHRIHPLVLVIYSSCKNIHLNQAFLEKVKLSNAYMGRKYVLYCLKEKEWSEVKCSQHNCLAHNQFQVPVSMHVYIPEMSEISHLRNDKHLY